MKKSLPYIAFLALVGCCRGITPASDVVVTKINKFNAPYDEGSLGQDMPVDEFNNVIKSCRIDKDSYMSGFIGDIEMYSGESNIGKVIIFAAFEKTSHDGKDVSTIVVKTIGNPAIYYRYVYESDGESPVLNWMSKE